MKQQIRAFIGGLALALVLAATMVNASPQWAVTTTNSEVYLMNYDNPGTPTNATGTIPQGSSLGGVAVWGDYVFVAGAGALYIGKIDTTGLIPKIDWLNNVPLSTSAGDVAKPTAVAVDGTGGVYVINDPQSTTHSSFAYLPSSGETWASAGLNVFTIVDSHGDPSAYFSDVATSGNGTQAIIAHTDSRDGDLHYADQSWVTAITSAGVSGTNLPDQYGYKPRGIAMGTNGLSYVVNHLTDTGYGPVEQGSISVISSSSLASVVTAAIGTGTFQPTDVSFFTTAGVNYLGIVGTTAGENQPGQAWLVTLDANGLPLMDTVVSKPLGNSNAFCSVSPDGSVFWVTNPGTGVVTALNTQNWTEGVTWSVPGQPQYIAAFTPSVPEPSSLAVLLTGSIGLIGTLRRRRRR